MKLENLHIIIADDHPLFRQALQLALNQGFNHTHWYEAESTDALQMLLGQKQDYDLVLLDLQMPGAYGYSTLIHLRASYPELPVVMISAYEDAQTISHALHHGCAGFIPKSADMTTLTQALEAILYGDIWYPPEITLLDVTDTPTADKLAELTPQQYRVLQMFAAGLLNKQIAYELAVSEATVKAHATAIFRKLGVRSRTQAVIALQQLELGNNTSQ